MQKLRLNLEALEVSSFDTFSPGRGARGTVRGHFHEAEADETGMACAWTGSCPANSFSCGCVTTALPQM